jgi:hypothetical protein
MTFLRLTGPIGPPGSDAIGVPQIWGYDGDAFAPGAFDITEYERVASDGSVQPASDGDWLIDTTPMLYQIRGGALVRITPLNPGPAGPPGPLGATSPHVHTMTLNWTYGGLKTKPLPVTLSTPVAVKV